ncbi:hypothetical protein, partial [Salmonella sp. SAL4448]|uniref:hypothetical protein n=1 Tax=Salmonella sp. SAL4448 TaxID=3159903 RepID=UPI00397E3BE9
LTTTQKLSTPVAQSNRLIYQGTTQEDGSNKFVPLIVLSALCLLFFLVARLKGNRARSVTRITDALLLYITGLLGLV